MKRTDGAHEDVQPPSADLVARRCLALAALVCRASIESGAGQPDAESLYVRVRDWVGRVGLQTEFEAFEQKAIEAPLGELKMKDVTAATWEVEGLAILAWALKLGELPRHDEKVDPYEVTESVSFLQDDAPEAAGAAGLRSGSELLAYRELVYAIHARLDEFSRTGRTADFASRVDMRWLHVLKIDPATVIVDGDLAIGGKQITLIGRDLLETCTWLTLPRHRASVWLLGRHRIYSKTPADT